MAFDYAYQREMEEIKSMLLTKVTQIKTHENIWSIEEFEENIKEAIERIFYEKTPGINKFKSVLKEIKRAIKEVQKIPIGDRTYEEW